MLQACSNTLQDAQVEVDYVPAGQYVGIELGDARAEAIQCGPFVGEADGVFRHGAPAAIDNQHFIDAGAIQRDGEQPLRLGIGLDIEREHARVDLNASGSKLRIVEHPADTDAWSRLALDLAPAFDATFDQVAHRKTHIGLEGVDAARVQPVAQLGYIGRCRDFKLAHRCAFEGVLASGLWLRCAQREHTLDIVRANIKVRALPVVAHQKGPAIH
jgi:hypothetical protein